MAERRQGGFIPTPPGRRIRVRLHRGEYIVSPRSQVGREFTRRVNEGLLERPERDEREIAAEVSRPQEPGGEAR